MNMFHGGPEHSFEWLFGLIVTGGCALLVACGGGGGGGGDDRIAITSVNAEQVASKTATVPMGIASLGSFPEEIVTASIQAPHRTGLAGYVLEQVLLAGRTLADTSHVTVSATETDTIPCTTGQMVVTAEDADNDGAISAGDHASVVIEDCQDEGLGGTVSGTLTIDIDTVSGEFETLTAPYSLGVTARFADFVIADEDTSLTVNGDMGITAGSEDGVVFTSSIRGDSLAAVETGTAADNERLRDYAFTLTSDTGAGEYTLGGHGDLRSEALGGSVRFEITTPYTELETENFPHAGAMAVTGSSDSRLTITALDVTQVRLDTDEDGDGTVDATATVLWETLDE